MMINLETNLALETELNHLLHDDLSSVIEYERTAFDAQVEPYGRSIVLFGAGNLGRKALACLRQDGIEPLAFADNNPSLWGSKVSGINVYSPEEAAEKFGQNSAFVVTIWNSQSGHRFSQTKQKLITLSCKKIMSFVSLTWKYPSAFLPNYFMDLPHKIFENRGNILKTFNLWADQISRITFLTQLKWRLLADFDKLPGRTSQLQYFPEDIFASSKKDVFIDCGAYVGDTVINFLRKTDFSFAHIFAIEPDPFNFQQLQVTIQKLPDRLKENVSLLQKAVGKQESNLRFSTTGTASSKALWDGNSWVNCVTLDNILNNTEPTFIKMDIEGAEVDALLGAQQIISKSKPLLAICVYHEQDHLWRIPILIKSIFDQYQLFLRPHCDDGWELVCYAVPNHRLTTLR